MAKEQRKRERKLPSKATVRRLRSAVITYSCMFSLSDDMASLYWYKNDYYTNRDLTEKQLKKACYLCDVWGAYKPSDINAACFTGWYNLNKFYGKDILFDNIPEGELL